MHTSDPGVCSTCWHLCLKDSSRNTYDRTIEFRHPYFIFCWQLSNAVEDVIELIFYLQRLLSYSISSPNKPEHLPCFQILNQYALSLKQLQTLSFQDFPLSLHQTHINLQLEWFLHGFMCGYSSLFNASVFSLQMVSCNLRYHIKLSNHSQQISKNLLRALDANASSTMPWSQFASF